MVRFLLSDNVEPSGMLKNMEWGSFDSIEAQALRVMDTRSSEIFFILNNSLFSGYGTKNQSEMIPLLQYLLR
jgi:hypothetical protein